MVFFYFFWLVSFIEIELESLLIKKDRLTGIVLDKKKHKRWRWLHQALYDDGGRWD